MEATAAAAGASEAVEGGAEPAEQSAAAVALQPGRGERLETAVKPYAEFCEQTQGRLVRDQTLQIAASGAQHGEAADGGRRSEILDRNGADARQRHRRDEPAG